MNIKYINIESELMPYYLSYRSYIVLVMSNKEFYKKKLNDKIIKKVFYTPRTRNELYNTIDIWIKDKEECKNKYGDISRWNTKYITDMSYIFYCAVNFNEDINEWIVYNVKKMNYMFYCAINFNKPLNKWNVKNVNNMSSMFSTAKSFNQPLDEWNIVNVKTMNFMFSAASSYNKNLNKWKIKRKKVSCSGMFYNAYRMAKLNLPIYT